MFQNQSYKQKLSFYHNEDVDNIANINIVLSTNHEINKDMLTNISDTISKLFINNYTKLTWMKLYNAQTMKSKN